MKNQEEFLLQQQRLSTDGKIQRKNSFHFNDLSWEEDGQKVNNLIIITNLFFIIVHKRTRTTGINKSKLFK